MDKERLAPVYGCPTTISFSAVLNRLRKGAGEDTLGKVCLLFISFLSSFPPPPTTTRIGALVEKRHRASSMFSGQVHLLFVLKWLRVVQRLWRPKEHFPFCCCILAPPACSLFNPLFSLLPFVICSVLWPAVQ